MQKAEVHVYRKIICKKLWKLLINKDMTRRDLRNMTGISTAAIAKMGKLENIHTDSLIRICKALECYLSDIMEIEHDEADDFQ